MGLEIQQREQEGVAILDLSGRVVAGEEVGKLREATRVLGEGGKARIVLNMADVDYVDSTGLGGLVMIATGLKKAGGGAKLLNLKKRNLDLLVVTKLTTVFEVFTDEQDAVNSFFPGREIRRFDILSFVREQQEEK